MASLGQETKFSLKRGQIIVKLLPHQICVDNIRRHFHQVSWLVVSSNVGRFPVATSGRCGVAKIRA